jgi:Glucose / Sorbosone dehydrogenase
VRLVLLPLALVGVLAVLGLVRDDDPAPAAEPEARLAEVGAFDDPVHLTSPPGDERVFVVEKKGRIRVLVDGKPRERPFLDISRDISTTGFEEGLLSLAFAPDYATSGLFYVDYTDVRHATVVEEFRVSRDPDVADPGSRRRVLVIPNTTQRHHGGHILFGPDGRLWISQGDGGTSFIGNFPAQRLDNLHGKVLRIDPRPQGGRSYGIPPDNPFVGRPGRDEIWAYGLRNPWRIEFDPAGALVIGDVGQLSAEEVDVAPVGGLNFGWSCFEGTAPFTFGVDPPASCRETVFPALELIRGSARTVGSTDARPVATRGRPRIDARLTHGDPVCSITLGVFARDAALPGLRGRHLFGDFCDPALRSFRLDGGDVVDVRPVGLEVPLLTSFGVDSGNRIYALSHGGAVYRLEPR